jgi:hypothetical protein
MWYATVTRPAPVVETDPLYVIIPDWDPKHKWGPCLWQPKVTRYDANVAEPADPAHVGGGAEAAHIVQLARRIMPVVGSIALVLFDNRQNLWVVQWL